MYKLHVIKLENARGDDKIWDVKIPFHVKTVQGITVLAVPQGVNELKKYPDPGTTFPGIYDLGSLSMLFNNGYSRSLESLPVRVCVRFDQSVPADLGRVAQYQYLLAKNITLVKDRVSVHEDIDINSYARFVYREKSVSGFMGNHDYDIKVFLEYIRR